MLNDDLKSIEMIALKSRERPDFGSEMRKIQRWFSKTFSTPLREVEQLDIHYLLLHKYEDFVNQLSDDDYLKYKNALLFPEKIQEKEVEDDEWMESELKRELQAEEAKLKTEKQPENAPLEEEFDIEF